MDHIDQGRFAVAGAADGRLRAVRRDGVRVSHALVPTPLKPPVPRAGR
jgi:hypothetical protein